MNKKRHRQDAFTIVELLIVVVVVAILAAITIVVYTGVTSKAHEAALMADLRGGATQLQLIRAKDGSYPSIATFDPNADLNKIATTTFTYQNLGVDFCLEAKSSSLGDKVFHANASGAVSSGVCLSGDSEGPGGSGNEGPGGSGNEGSSGPDNPTLAGTPYTLNQLAEVCSSTANAPSGYNVVTGLSGTSGNDIIYASGITGSVSAGNGDDIVCRVGGTGNVDGGSGDDILYVDGGSGTVNGSAGSDVIVVLGPRTGNISGSSYDDTIYIRGSVGPTVDGSTGSDKLVFLDDGPVPLTITSFESIQGKP